MAVSGAKRSLRAELKQRLRALSAEERLRQSHLLAQKVRDHDDSHLRAGAAAGRRQTCGSAQARPFGRAHVRPPRARSLSARESHSGCRGAVGHSVAGISAAWRVMGLVREGMEVGDRVLRQE